MKMKLMNFHMKRFHATFDDTSRPEVCYVIADSEGGHACSNFMLTRTCPTPSVTAVLPASASSPLTSWCS